MLINFQVKLDDDSHRLETKKHKTNYYGILDKSKLRPFPHEFTHLLADLMAHPNKLVQT